MSAGERGSIVLWDYNKEKIFWKNSDDENCIINEEILSIDLDNDMCIIAGRDKTIRVWQLIEKK